MSRFDKVADMLNHHSRWFPVIWAATLIMSSGITVIVIETLGLGPCR